MSLYKLMDVNDKKYVYDGWQNVLRAIDEEFYGILSNKICNDLYYHYTELYGLRDLFIDSEFIFDNPQENSKYLWKINNTQRQLILGLTEKCNMRCEYCGYYDTRYIDNTAPKFMSKETLEKALANFLMTSQESDLAGISFYGGEPLLCMELIRHAVAYNKKNHLGQKIQYLISTNGLLLNDPSIVDFLVSNDFQIIISLDGPRSLHDRYRLDSKGNATYSRIMNNLKIIKNKYPDYFKAKVTFNAVICPPYNTELLFNYFNGINVNFLDLNLTKFFEAKLINTYGTSKFEENEPLEITAPLNAIEHLKNLRKYHILSENNMPNISIASGFCFPLERKLYVAAEGKIYLCERVDEHNEDFCLGDVNGGINNNKLSNLLEKTIGVFRENCSKCWAIRLCSACFITLEKIKYNESYCCDMRLKIEKEFKQYIKLVNEDNTYIDVFNNLTVD